MSVDDEAGEALALRGIVKRFGGVLALDAADLVVRRGSIPGRTAAASPSPARRCAR